MSDDAVRERASKIKLLLMDCDGVLTDGRLYFSAAGEAMKVFNVRDGQGIASWHKAGYRSGVITGRDAKDILERRTSELQMEFLITKVSDKVQVFNEIIADAGVTPEETAYIGDDTPDIELLRLVGLAAAPADADRSVINVVHYVTSSNGGAGAVRDVIDLLLSSK